MATRTSTYHVEDLCDLPSCIQEDAQVLIFLMDGDLTTDGKAYFNATVVEVDQLSTGGVDVTVSYEDSTLPNDLQGEDGLTIGEDVCTPDCAGDCDWAGKMINTIESSATSNLITRSMVIYEDAEWVEDGTFDLKRIPLDPGYRITSAKLTCNRYDNDTDVTVRLKVGGTIHAEYIGDLGSIATMSIIDSDLDLDVLPRLEISGTTNAVYLDGAKGLVLELMGLIVPV